MKQEMRSNMKTPSAVEKRVKDREMTWGGFRAEEGRGLTDNVPISQ